MVVYRRDGQGAVREGRVAGRAGEGSGERWGGKRGERGREAGREGEGSGERRGGKWGEREREAWIGYHPVHPHHIGI